MIKLSRSIMIDSGEIIPAGTVLKNYGEFTPLSIAPSQSVMEIEKSTKGLRKKLIKKIGLPNIIYFFRIPRECVASNSICGSLKKEWVKGDERVAPFPCSVSVGRYYAEERKIEELLEMTVEYMSCSIQYFDRNFKRINVVSISSLGNFGLGSLYKFGELKSVKTLSKDYFNGISSCIMYYYPNTSQMKVELISRKKFYVEQPTYRIEKQFDELEQESVNCYTCDSSHKFCQRLYILEKGDNEWYENFISAHSWLADTNYIPIDNDSHIFGKYEYYDGQKDVYGLTILHRSNNPYRFFTKKRLMVLIKENPVNPN